MLYVILFLIDTRKCSALHCRVYGVQPDSALSPVSILPVFMHDELAHTVNFLVEAKIAVQFRDGCVRCPFVTVMFTYMGWIRPFSGGDDFRVETKIAVH